MTTQPTLDELMEELQQQLQIVLKALEGAQAEMVAAVVAEREACADLAKDMGEWIKAETPEKQKLVDQQNGRTYSSGYILAAERIEKAIRARGKT